MGKTDDNPMDPVQRLRDAPRCQAMAKSTQERCKCPAVRGWRVCRVHGARGGHRAGPSHPKWVHGGRSREAFSSRRIASLLSKMSREDHKIS